MKTKAIALLRVSSAAQAGVDRQGLPAQRRACQRIADQHDLSVSRWVTLEGISGAVVVDHPEFQAVLSEIRDPEVGGLIVADIDRLMRPEDPGHYAVYRTLRETNTVLYTSSGPRDFRHDRLLMMLESEIAAIERIRIKERTQRGRAEKRRQGKRAEGPVGMPRGVRFDYETETWDYCFPEAEKVREVFRLYMSGIENFREIHRRTGIGTATDQSAAISRVLRQTLYKGVYRVDRRWSAGKAVPLSEEEVQEYEVLSPPLIDPEDWDRVQVRLAQRAATRPPISDPETRPGIYGGFLECSICGAHLQTVKDSRLYWAYRCGNYQTDRKGCSTGQISIRKADPEIDAVLDRTLGDIETLTLLLNKAAREETHRAENRPEETTRRITDLKNQKARVKDAYQAGAFTLKELQKRIGALDGEISVLEGLLNRAHEALEFDQDLVTDLVEVFTFWRDLPRREKRELLRTWHIRIGVTKTEAGRSGQLDVQQVTIGSLGYACIYKKMKRLGIA